MIRILVRTSREIIEISILINSDNAIKAKECIGGKLKISLNKKKSYKISKNKICFIPYAYAYVETYLL